MLDSGAWQVFFSQFHFLRPWWLLALLPLGIIFYFRWQQDSKPALTQNLPAHLRKALTVGEQGWSKLLPLKLLALLIFLAVLVCAGPSWQRQASPFGEDKAPLVIALDVSESMLQNDIAPSRLERAKQKVTDLVAARDGGRTGLVVFAGSAHIAMPLTKDKQVYLPFLTAVDPTIMPVQGKRPDTILPMLEPLMEQDSGGSVVMITDGIAPQMIDRFKMYFTQHDYQLLIFAMGNTERATQQPLDISALKQLASVTNGRVITVSADDGDIQTINHLIERHMQLNGESAMPWKDSGYYLLMPIAIIMLLWFRKGWLVQWCVVATLCLGSGFSPLVSAQPVHSVNQESMPSAEPVSQIDKLWQWWLDLWLTPDQQGAMLFNQQEYLAAGQHYQDPMLRGIAYYYAREFNLAQSAFIETDSLLGDYYAASALAHQREYVAARRMLTTLNNNPQVTGELKRNVEHNLKVIVGLIDEVNQQSKDQQGGLEQETSIELEEDQPQTGEGADEQTSADNIQQAQLTADQIINDQAMADTWLKRVEADPKKFLQAKFQIQLRDQPSSATKERQQ
ncbi:VWA domain-containing protein [Vibrio sp. AK197]